jgi:hypothetical protein
MNLSNLTPAKGSIKNRKRIGRGEVLDMVVRLHVVTKELSRVQDIRLKSDLKVVKCHFNVVCLNSVL